NARASSCTSRVRSPRAMFASTRCSPQVGSGTAWSWGAPGAAVISNTFALSADEQGAVDAPWASTRGGDTVGRVGAVSGVARPMVVAGANGVVGTIESSFADPPWSAAGLVHSTWSPGAVVRPKREFAGTGPSKVEKATAHPISRDDRHAGTF